MWGEANPLLLVDEIPCYLPGNSCGVGCIKWKMVAFLSFSEPLLSSQMEISLMAMKIKILEKQTPPVFLVFIGYIYG